LKPPPFRYHDPRTVEEALGLLAEHGDEARLLAGGQSLVPLLNLRRVRPRVLIDLNRVEGLDGVDAGAGVVRTGALARAVGVERAPAVASVLPVLPEALLHVAYPQVRTRTTIGGNVAHADPAAELPAVLAAVGGDVRLRSAGGQRTLGWSAFFSGRHRTACRPDEMVVAVDFPVAEGFAYTFSELTPKLGSFAIVGACVGLSRSGDEVTGARIALCGVADTPVRLQAAEQRLTGGAVDAAALEDVRALVAGAIDPPGDLHAPGGYRSHVAGVLVVRGLRRLWGAAA
jgi:carbon-monoxide dehydrogenase medium subunit